MSTTTPTRTEESRQPFHKANPSWTAVAGLLLTVTMPVCGWMVTLSSRVSVLEEKTSTLATAAQMAEVKQKIEDWIQVSERERHETVRDVAAQADRAADRVIRESR